MRKIVRHWIDDVSAQAAAEFAMVLPFFLILLFAIITLGYYMNAQQVVTQAAREGARTGAITNDDCQIEAAARAVMGRFDGNADRTTVEISGKNDPSLRERADPLIIKVSYDVPITYNELPDAFQTITSRSVASIEKNEYTPCGA